MPPFASSYQGWQAEDQDAVLEVVASCSNSRVIVTERSSTKFFAAQHSRS
ncbi:MAG: hypothetical protein OJF50_005814 [Nitrospira sp.]|nr:hypothetical protein [Nitrospira sp.]